MDTLLVPLHETYRLVDESIRPGNSGSDLLAVVRPITTGVATTVTVPFKPGSKVYAVPLVEYDVTEMAAVNGQVPLTGEVAITATGTKVMIFGKSLNQQF